jgi:enamine deaminase RidA (YjgF/YER057c/UK114 family)
MKVIDTTNAPGAIGPYSQAYVTNGLIFTSSQLPVDPATGEMPARSCFAVKDLPKGALCEIEVIAEV